MNELVTGSIQRSGRTIRTLTVTTASTPNARRIDQRRHLERIFVLRAIGQ
jgi:hypothetical protein